MNYKIIPAPKKVSDWNNKAVITKVDLENYYGIIKAGSLMIQGGNKNISKLVAINECECCGFKPIIAIKGPAKERLKKFEFIELEVEEDNSITK
jgi:hypothetical protein